MEKIMIEGGRPLSGGIAVHGAKNSALPILAAAYAAHGVSVIHNCPDLSDVRATAAILTHLGCIVKREGDTVTVDSANANGREIPAELMREMRSSIVFLGAMLGRDGRAALSSPGGCELGPRPIDLHLSSLTQMGAAVEERGGLLDCSAGAGLAGTRICLPIPSVGATENILLAASTARGVTEIQNAAREPEISDLADFLNRCGARIHGAGESMIHIDGVAELCGAEHTVIPDRIVASTYMAAAAITRGRVTVLGVIPAHLAPVIPAFLECGCEISVSGRELTIAAPQKLRRIRTVRTLYYPGFPTDSGPLLLSVASVADGTSMFVENIFQHRFGFTDELMRLGAKVKVENNVAVVDGVEHLRGAPVHCTDLRGGAALMLAALAADGVSEVRGIHHVERGYLRLDEALRALDVQITRITRTEDGEDMP